MLQIVVNRYGFVALHSITKVDVNNAEKPINNPQLETGEFIASCWSFSKNKKTYKLRDQFSVKMRPDIKRSRAARKMVFILWMR